VVSASRTQWVARKFFANADSENSQVFAAGRFRLGKKENGSLEKEAPRAGLSLIP
jgi:hypothetical protein